MLMFAGVVKSFTMVKLLEESLLLTKVFLLAVRQNVSWLFPILSDYPFTIFRTEDIMCQIVSIL